ncbi:MAG: hypothetical protein GC200_03520 [Tepidisphaera sp.]|nr:hypothetical protein [Tepidisphaera sp.]
MRQTPLVLIALLGGCAATYTEPTLPPNHPANLGAGESPPPERSHTLDIGGAGAELVPSMPAAQPIEHGEPSKPMPDMGSGGHKHETPPSSSASGEAIYTCPMHPEVTSDKPDQRCPKCGMKLKKVEGGKQP